MLLCIFIYIFLKFQCEILIKVVKITKIIMKKYLRARILCFYVLQFIYPWSPSMKFLIKLVKITKIIMKKYWKLKYHVSMNFDLHIHGVFAWNFDNNCQNHKNRFFFLTCTITIMINLDNFSIIHFNTISEDQID